MDNNTTQTHPKKFVDIENARHDEQRHIMKQIIAEGLCPFCYENLTRHHKRPIFREGKYWLLTENQWPYDNSKKHFMAVLLTHAEHLSEVPPEAGQELLEFFQWVEQTYHVPGGGFAMRFGDNNYSAGTVAHLHAHFILPDWENENFEPIHFKIGKTKKKSQG